MSPASPPGQPALHVSRKPAIAGGALAVVCVVAVVIALTLGRSSTQASSLTGAKAAGLTAAASAPPVPPLDATDWIQTQPLTDASLRGKVVLVDFWDASCINCRRTFPFLGALSKTYAAQGLVVLGVHSPEFAFEKNAAYVARSAKELGVTWAVANDPEMKIWNEFGNQYWPAQYLVDRNGKVRFAHAGEGEDNTLEGNVRALLNEGDSAGAATVGAVHDSEIAPTGGTEETPETYVGAERGSASLPQGVVAVGTTVNRTDPLPQKNAVGLDGSFTGGAEMLTLQPNAKLNLHYLARDVYVILAPHSPAAGAGSPPVDVSVTLAGKPVPPALRGPSLSTGPDGGTVVHVTQQDLFHLLTGPTGSNKEATLTVTAGGSAVDVYTFTFGA